MKKLFPAIVFLFCCLTLNAQDNIRGKKKVYEAWVKPANGSAVIKGVFYETGDSSIYLLPSLHSERKMEFHYNNIELLKFRRQYSVRRGLTTGSAIGFTTGAIMGISMADDIFFQSLFALGGGTIFGIYGLGVGALAGTLKDRMPVGASYENFDKYKGSLQKYSYFDEKPVVPEFVHRGYVSTSLGFSFAGGEFATQVPLSNYPGMNRSGSGFKGEIGYFFTKHVGINWTSQYRSYWVEGHNDFRGWHFQSELIGPVFSLSASDKLRFDIIPSAGYSSAYLYRYSDDLLNNRIVTLYTGQGFGLSFSGRMVYSMSKRWNASASAGYITSKQEYKQGGTGKASALDISVGMNYKFGKKSL